MKDLAIVIINYRTPELTVNCLKSLAPEIQPEKHQVVVVDNASGDNSVPLLESFLETNQYQSWASLIASGVNGGFSAGNNIGIKSVAAKAYWLLNSDTLVTKNAVNTLLDYLNANPDIGIVGPRLTWPDRTPQISCFRFHSPLSELIASASTSLITNLLRNFDVPIPVTEEISYPQWVSFASVIIRREVFDEIGLMDEGYFMYFEDVDFCRTAFDHGWKIAHIPTAEVVHLRGGSSSTKTDIKARRRPPQYVYESRSRYFKKFYGRLGVLLANLCWLLGRGISYWRELMGNKAPHTCLGQGRDIWIDWLANQTITQPSNLQKLN